MLSALVELIEVLVRDGLMMLVWIGVMFAIGWLIGRYDRWERSRWPK